MDGISFCYLTLCFFGLWNVYGRLEAHPALHGALRAVCWQSDSWRCFNIKIRPIKALWALVLRNASRWACKRCQSRLNWFLVSWGDLQSVCPDVTHELWRNGSPMVSFHLFPVFRAFTGLLVSFCLLGLMLLAVVQISRLLNSFLRTADCSL